MARDEYGSDDPTDIRSLAVTTEDVVTALESTLRASKPAVLRVTPPFYGRMRARLHLAGSEGPGGDGGAIHLGPTDLVDPVPAYPDPDQTEDELRQGGEYTRERHRERHLEAVEAWRERVRSAIVESLALETADGTHDVEVKRLG